MPAASAPGPEPEDGRAAALTLLGGDSRTAARALIGAVLWHRGIGVQLTETEAYAGSADPGSHAYRGRTARNEVMFGPPGHLYVYFIYGMHHCANVITGPVDEAGGVLMRAGRVVTGAELAAERSTRGRDPYPARGPARLARLLGLDRAANGADLDPEVCADPIAAARSWGAGSQSLRLWLPRPSGVALPGGHAARGRDAESTVDLDESISTGPRVGLRHGADLPWRFWVTGEGSVTDYRPAPKSR